MKSEEKVRWIYNSKTNEELADRYAEWAQTYEQDLEKDFGYVSPQLTLPYFIKYVPQTARVLDAGAGTGLIGKLLHEAGYRQLVALDLSEAMLAEARRKNVYSALQVGTLGETLDFATDEFDAVISVGVFTLGHAPASAFDELVRVTKPGGHIVFTLHNDLYQEGDFPAKLAELETAGRWSRVEVSPEVYPTPINEPDVTIRVLIYKVGKS